MLKNILNNNSLKYISFWLSNAMFCVLAKFCFNWPGNFNLIFGLQLFLAQYFGPMALGTWTAFNIFSYDLLTESLGFWSVVTSSSYFLVSLLTKFFINSHKLKLIKHQNYSFINFLKFTLLITIFYDLVTASTGPLFFNQGWCTMLVGQVPFTVVHVISNCLSTSFIYGVFMAQNKFYKKLGFVKLGLKYVAK